MSEAPTQSFDDLLIYLRNTRGFDFSAYKPNTLKRRIEKRMLAAGVANEAEYLDYLQVHPEEFALLFNTILINVTSFFRDKDAWDYMRAVVVPSILERRDSHETIRIWCAGCASGEEAYTLAILFAEAMGADQFRSRIKLYATDLDDEALQQSRQAIYTAKDLEEADPEIISRYFELVEGRYIFDRELRRAIIFGKHDLIMDAPISRIDLLTCRNTLMYFNAEVQEKILSRFHFALNEGGFLFLGKAETMLTHGNIFTPLEMKHRVFTKNGHTNTRDRLLAMGRPNESNRTADDLIQLRLRELALDASPVAQIVVSNSGIVSFINERARTRFGLTLRDVGKSLQDLEVSYKPLELRSLIEQVHSQRRPIMVKEVAWSLPSGEKCYLDIHITPLVDGAFQTTSVTFTDVTDFKRLQEELLHFNQELETAYEELQSTNEELQTTNEELQSTVEELETTNEELHSTNEELETMNEELQSTNEELEAINTELQRTGDELGRTNAFMHSVLSSLRASVIVVGADLDVLAWNERSHDLWGLRPEEARGKHILNLDIGFPVDKLRVPIRNVIASPDGPVEFEVDAINRRGKPMRTRVTCAPLRAADTTPIGVIVAIEESD
jgi:two-component system, chemotaxis family, CheB/CheR fusion protein